MPIMAEQKKNNRKPVGRARSRGEVRLLTLEVDPRLAEALENFAAQDRRSKRTVLTMALEEFLTQKGFWPPQSE
jgi:hypothetical protein